MSWRDSSSPASTCAGTSVLSGFGPAALLGLDDYDWKARKRPFFFVVLPVAFAVGAWFPTLHWWLSVPTVALCLLVGVCGEVGRSGKAQEEALFARWGGKPTTRLLRHRDSSLPTQKLKALHQKLGALTGIKAPSRGGEAKDAQEADKIYESYVTFLRNNTRHRQHFPFLRSELISYGFARNCLGLRSFGIAVSALAALGAGARLVALHHQNAALAAWGLPLVMLVFVLLLLGFWLWVRESWVKSLAHAYAKCLIEAADVLPFQEDR